MHAYVLIDVHPIFTTLACLQNGLVAVHWLTLVPRRDRQGSHTASRGFKRRLDLQVHRVHAHRVIIILLIALAKQELFLPRCHRRLIFVHQVLQSAELIFDLDVRAAFASVLGDNRRFNLIFLVDWYIKCCQTFII